MVVCVQFLCCERSSLNAMLLMKLCWIVKTIWKFGWPCWLSLERKQVNYVSRETAFYQPTQMKLTQIWSLKLHRKCIKRFSFPSNIIQYNLLVTKMQRLTRVLTLVKPTHSFNRFGTSTVKFVYNSRNLSSSVNSNIIGQSFLRTNWPKRNIQTATIPTSTSTTPR